MTANNANSTNVDFDSVSTYIPGVVLLICLNTQAAVSCVYHSTLCTAYMSLAGFGLNWWLTPRSTGHWNMLRHGGGIWLSWIAYGALIFGHGNDAKNEHATPSAAMAHSTAQLFISHFCALVAAALATVQGLHYKTLQQIAAPLALVGLFVPNIEASFDLCSCVVRVVKATAFALMYAFFHLYVHATAPHDGTKTQVQTITLCSAWVLLADHRCIFLAIPQITVAMKLLKQHQEKPSDDSASHTFDLESVTVANDIWIPTATNTEETTQKTKHNGPTVSDFERTLLDQAATKGTHMWKGIAMPPNANNEPKDTPAPAPNPRDPLATFERNEE